MKFATALQFNAKPEWRDHYIDYDGLKEVVYELEQDRVHDRTPQVPYSDDAELETGRLLADSERSSPFNAIFTRKLDEQLAKIKTFYAEQEAELGPRLTNLADEIKALELEGALDDSDDEGDEEEGWLSAKKWSRRLKTSFGLGDEGTSDGAGSVRPKRKANRRGSLSVYSTHSDYDEESTTASPVLHAAEHGSRGPQPAVASPRPAHPELPEGGAPPVGRHPRASTRGSSKRPAAGDRRWSTGTFDDDDDEDEDDAMTEPDAPHLQRMGGSFWSSNSGAGDPRMKKRRLLQELFIDFNSLRSFESMNYTGFRKILKKYEKTTGQELRDHYMVDVIEQTDPFSRTAKARLQSHIDRIVSLYARVVTKPRGDDAKARAQLSVFLQDFIVYERTTIWRQVLSNEYSKSRTRGESKPLVQNQSLIDAATELRALQTPCGRLRIPAWANKQTIGGALAIALLIGICNSNLLTRPEERNCLGILVFVTIFWAAEVIPLFVTAFLVPFLVVVLRVLRSDDGTDTRLPAPDAAKYIFSQMFSPTIMLLLGGFTLAAALSKSNIHKVMATKVLRLAGTRPSSVLLAYMFVAAFASMWISNVAAPVLCFSLIQPILRTVPPQSAFPKALILGIALASNIGGQSSPISSPQNLIALEYMNPPISWLEWFAISIPTGIVSLILIWILLMFSYPLSQGTGAIQPAQDSRDKWGIEQTFVLVVTIATIALLCVERQLMGVFGEMGVIAIIPIVIFFGTGILQKSDFETLPWGVVFLAMGGIALGKSVLSSGLLDDLDSVLENVLRDLGDNVWLIVALFTSICLVIATLISHTVAAALIVPIAAKVGEALGQHGGQDYSRLLIMVTALVCSAGMGLPVSGYPNMAAINLENDYGLRYLAVSDFLKNGIPATLLSAVVIATLSYGIMSLLHI